MGQNSKSLTNCSSVFSAYFQKEKKKNTDDAWGMHFSSAPPQTQYLNMTDLSIGIAVYLLYVLTDFRELARYSKCVTVS